MLRRLSKVDWCCLTITWLCLGAATISQAQEVPIKVREEKISKLKEDLKKVLEQIDKNCTSLEETMRTANSSTDVLPYQTNTPRYNFNQYCTNDGTLRWTSTTVLDTNDPEKNVDDTIVTGVATKLQASHMGDQELVELITDPASIDVTYNGQTDTRPGWDLDLNGRKYATVFLSTLKELGPNLKKRDELAKNLTDEQAALDKQRPKPKSKAKRKRRAKPR